jgi:CHASE3 domain sensor protein
MTTTHKLVASLAGVLLLIAAMVVMAISFWAFSQIKEAAGARKHTFVVIDSANGCAAEALI